MARHGSGLLTPEQRCDEKREPAADAAWFLNENCVIGQGLRQLREPMPLMTCANQHVPPDWRESLPLPSHRNGASGY